MSPLHRGYRFSWSQVCRHKVAFPQGHSNPTFLDSAFAGMTTKRCPHVRQSTPSNVIKPAPGKSLHPGVKAWVAGRPVVPNGLYLAKGPGFLLICTQKGSVMGPGRIGVAASRVAKIGHAVCSQSAIRTGFFPRGISDAVRRKSPTYPNSRDIASEIRAGYSW